MDDLDSILRGVIGFLSIFITVMALLDPMYRWPRHTKPKDEELPGEE